MQRINKKIMSSQSPTEWLVDNSALIYLLLFYAAGLLLSAFLFRALSEESVQKLVSIFAVEIKDFRMLFMNRLAVYLSLYTTAVLLGLCVVGFPVLHLLPLFCGLGLGFRVAYCYSLGWKSTGSAFLLIIPEAAVFITVLTYTLRICSELSHRIFTSSLGKTVPASEKSTADYIKFILLFALLIALIAFINAGLTYILTPLIK